jgi:predicted transcriptional regulator
MKTSTPYSELLPPLSSEEKDALRSSIEAEGVLVPIDVDSDGNVLDGHHRFKCDPKAPRVVRTEVKTDAERRAFVFRSNLARRNLSVTQRTEVKARLRAVARDLKTEGKTQEQIAAMLGVARPTVTHWFEGHNVQSNNVSTVETASTQDATPIPDSRVKINPKHKPIIAYRVERGETVQQVAADYGVAPNTIRRVVAEVAKREAVREERAKVAKASSGTLGVHHGDFRQLGSVLADGSVDLIFTDPPYLEEDLGLYGDLAQFASRVLRPGGWCLAYTGQFCLPAVLNLMSDHLTYSWVFAIYHSGGYIRFRKLRLYNGWKPIVAFHKPPLSVAWEWFNDYTSGGREKDDHEWQQSQLEAEHFISNMTPKKALVVDPFAGSGTTLVAAKALHRRFCGFEINADHVVTIWSRLA